ncbi:MAG: hypothetical protein A2020_11890 [Lentisphaerae bacterium GWF2_45_14]|nr:MAG: hypothetical protein A2020_11890 [Lentisphaerae bacterium GWF2_45_14]
MMVSADRSSHQLCELSVIGGFLDGVKFDFSQGLNCIIGARGTGKTTALELIRYAMGKMPESPAAGKRLESLVDANLNGGRIELKIRTKDGLNYIVSRVCGEAPVVLDTSSQPTGLTLRNGSFFKIDVYSQNEVENMADDPLSQLNLIDNFEPEKLSEIERQIRKVKSDLASNSNTLIPLYERRRMLNESVGTLPAIEEKLKSFAAENGENSEEINRAHALKGQRDRERRSMDAGHKLLADAESYISGSIHYIHDNLQNIFSKDIITGCNAQVIQDAMSDLLSCGENIDMKINQLRGLIKETLEKLSGHSARIEHLHTQQEMQFRSLIEKHRENQDKATERIKLEKRRNELLGTKNELGEIDKKIKNLKDERTLMLSELSSHRDKRFRLREMIVDRINSKLMPAVRVSINQYGNRGKYSDFLGECLKNGHMQYRKPAEKIAHAFWPSDIASVIREKKTVELMERAELSENMAKQALEALRKVEVLHKLEVIDLPDQPLIELNDHGNYKTTASLSTGQKCNTILPILLLDSDSPLLIDQPEDNLDNGFVHNTIVESICKMKGRRQMVFVTHNPNIPVLGDAERIFVLESDGTVASMRNSGGVDECKEEIVSLLEGGEQAFKKRKVRYSY